MLQIVTGIILVLFLLIFFFYASLTIKHAARFRYLSKRTVYLTVLFASISAVLITVALILYGLILL